FTTERVALTLLPPPSYVFFKGSHLQQNDRIFETKTAGVGEDVQLTCPRHISDYNANFFWIRLVSGNMPELLGRTYLFHYDGTKKTPRITAKEEPETFPLKISKADQSDTGLKLTVCFYFPGAEPEITTNFQLPPSDPVRPGDSVTLQCSVLFDSEKKTCPGDHSVYWFRAGSDEAHPSFIYAHGNNRDHYHCKKSPESESTQKCDYFFSKNVSSSDAGTHYCAVATCGEILFGNGTKLEIEGKSGIFLYNCSNCLFLFLISGCSVFRSYLKQ
uniref:Ig-like domain-containing protein n=1 Tax=Echeneis naucrates TaxID=173247 RepID=A0A665WCF5_ECHNA